MFARPPLGAGSLAQGAEGSARSSAGANGARLWFKFGMSAIPGAWLTTLVWSVVTILFAVPEMKSYARCRFDVGPASERPLLSASCKKPRELFVIELPPIDAAASIVTATAGGVVAFCAPRAKSVVVVPKVEKSTV